MRSKPHASLYSAAGCRRNTRRSTWQHWVLRRIGKLDQRILALPVHAGGAISLRFGELRLPRGVAGPRAAEERLSQCVPKGVVQLIQGERPGRLVEPEREL